MKMPFRRDTTAEIKRTTDQLSQQGAKLTALREKRAGYIAQDHDLAALTSIGDEIASTERLISTLQERLRLLDGRQKQERQEELEQRKAATLAALEKQLRAEVDAGVAVVDALVAAANAYIRFKEVRSRPRPWSTLLHNEHSLPIGPNDLLGSITSSFYWPKLKEGWITGLPKLAPALIERLRKAVDFDINRLRETPIPKSAMLEPEEESAA